MRSKAKGRPISTMTRLLPLLILAGLAAELASIIMVGNLLGVVPTLLLLLAGGALGISLIRSAGTNIVAALRSPVQASSLQRAAAGKAMARVIAGLFFLIPGFFSDLLGLLVLFPPVRQWLRSKLPVETYSTAGPAPGRRETIIDIEAIEIVAEDQPQDPAHRQGGGTREGR